MQQKHVVPTALQGDFSSPFRLGKKKKDLSAKPYFLAFAKCACGFSYKANNTTISSYMKVSYCVQARRDGKSCWPSAPGEQNMFTVWPITITNIQAALFTERKRLAIKHSAWFEKPASFQRGKDYTTPSIFSIYALLVNTKNNIWVYFLLQKQIITDQNILQFNFSRLI